MLSLGIVGFAIYAHTTKTSNARLADGKSTRTRVGTLSKKIAEAINKPARAIYVNDETLDKITTRHLPKLDIIGIDAIGFIKLILQNFTQILEDKSNGSLVLVYEPYENAPKVAALQIETKGKYYYIASAFPATQSYIGSKELIWVKK